MLVEKVAEGTQGSWLHCSCHQETAVEVCSELAFCFSPSLRSQPVRMVPFTFGTDLPNSITPI